MCWQANADDTLVEVKSKCRDLYQFTDFFTIQHIKSQKYLEKSSNVPTMIMHGWQRRAAFRFTDRLVFLYSIEYGDCVLQSGDNIVFGERATVAEYAAGSSCQNDSSHIIFLPGNRIVKPTRYK